MKNEPKRPLKDDPLELRLRGGSKTPSEWATLAQEAESEERWGEAYYYWLASSTAYTRNPVKANKIQFNAFKAFALWKDSEIS